MGSQSTSGSHRNVAFWARFASRHGDGALAAAYRACIWLSRTRKLTLPISRGQHSLAVPAARTHYEIGQPVPISKCVVSTQALLSKALCRRPS